MCRGGGGQGVLTSLPPSIIQISLIHRVKLLKISLKTPLPPQKKLKNSESALEQKKKTFKTFRLVFQYIYNLDELLSESDLNKQM